MERKIHNPWTWQDAAGFVQANEVSGVSRTVFCAGQTSVNSEGVPVHEGDMELQIVQAFANVETVLAQAGMTPADIVRMTVYTTDVSGFLRSEGPFLERLKETGCRQASTLIGVARLAHPSLLVELEATAVQ